MGEHAKGALNQPSEIDLRHLYAITEACTGLDGGKPRFYAHRLNPDDANQHDQFRGRNGWP
ncbi:hypothetical protein N7478_000780 [Penicillium angulare]|uniref:uncharacterized protein n=1 Tax=Penicillium angulare TaxID=116970 RepID=UPI0025414A6B|nr:uncharacterized protein N7478_000688 [Penicillium angulare]XP_056784875.1 uncharacterized protein N7478_000780 [Penicillium angulare]KAJ5291437.1 hypothetical protein N7478_000688 [Penicillium angulare]KAJ5291529.1 hypothetical protein N7478_000780 [Penicillium angulare]